MKLPERTFQPGDRVWSLKYGFQTVEQSFSQDFPLIVNNIHHRQDGRYLETDKHRSLFTPEEAKELFGVEETPPKEKVKRWRYYVLSSVIRTPFKTSAYYRSDDDLNSDIPAVKWCERIEESMREFEE